MLPIVDKPTIQYIIEEAVASGITDIIIITGRGKRSIEDHFDKSYELESTLADKGKWEELEEIQSISNLANIHYIRQKEPLGLGHAVLCARSFIGDSPFAVMLGDDLIDSKVPCLQQLISAYDELGGPILGVQRIDRGETEKYGIVQKGPKTARSGCHTVDGLIEKPDPSHAPSNLAIMGRYILTPGIFSYLEALGPGAGGEYQLTDAIHQYCRNHPVYAQEFDGERYDIGDKFGFIRATVDFALKRDGLGEELRAYLQQLGREE